jgi:hypothetical protein
MSGWPGVPPNQKGVVQAARRLQGRQHAFDLGGAARHPGLRDLVMQKLLVEQAHHLVAQPGGQGANAQHGAARRAGGRDQPGLARRLVQVIQDRRTLDQHLAIIQQQRRHAPQRVQRDEPIGIAEGGPGAMLVAQTEDVERDGNAPHERRIVLPDQDHRILAPYVFARR